HPVELAVVHAGPHRALRHVAGGDVGDPDLALAGAPAEHRGREDERGRQRGRAPPASSLHAREATTRVRGATTMAAAEPGEREGRAGWSRKMPLRTHDPFLCPAGSDTRVHMKTYRIAACASALLALVGATVVACGGGSTDTSTTEGAGGGGGGATT